MDAPRTAGIVPARPRLLVPLALVLLGLGPHAWASIITPPGLSPGDQFRLVFVTSQTHDATSSNIAVYDTFVAGLASAAALDTYNGSPVTWLALASTDTTAAISRLPADTIPIFRLDGIAVADGGGSDLWDGDLDAPLQRTELGTDVSDRVWTGSLPSGSADLFASLGDPFPIAGQSNVTGSIWVHFVTGNDPTTLFPMYAFSSVLTVPAQEPSAVPEPGTLTPLLLALGGLAGVRLIRRRRAAPSQR
jgi:MYXO-CTERM domain-containing protein